MPDRTEDLFAYCGLRCTRQRKALYDALSASRSHPTADELLRQVTTRLPGVSLATVYNTLEAFCKAGLVQKLPGAGVNGAARYDAVRDDHLHLRCQHTGAVRDVPDDLGKHILDRIAPETLSELEAQLGFKINQIQIELVGERAEASQGETRRQEVEETRRAEPGVPHRKLRLLCAGAKKKSRRQKTGEQDTPVPECNEGPDAWGVLKNPALRFAQNRRKKLTPPPAAPGSTPGATDKRCEFSSKLVSDVAVNPGKRSAALRG